MSDDIVARLRQTHRIQCECVGCESANEIERLRAERDELRKQRFEVDEAEENARLRIENALRSERDEARQLCCRMTAQFVYLSNELCTAKFVANEKGWDCYPLEEKKEDNHNA